MRKILLLLSNGFEALEASAFTDVFGWNKVMGDKKIELITSSLSPTIKSTWNFTVTTELPLKKVKVSEFQALVIPGGFGSAGFFTDTKDELFLSIIREFHEGKKIIVGVCTGVIPLAESGVLKGKYATTYLMDNDRYFMQLEKNGAIPVRKKIVRCDNLITSSAPGSAVETALLLLESLTDKDNSDNIKKNMGF